MSDADLERANTDVEDNDMGESSYYEEEVTDEEAMAKAAAEEKKDSDGEENETEDSDLGFYMPTAIARQGGSTEKKQKKTHQKITKIVRLKKEKKQVSGKPPRRDNSPGDLRSPGVN